MGTILNLNNDDIWGPRILIELVREKSLRVKADNMFHSI